MKDDESIFGAAPEKLDRLLLLGLQRLRQDDPSAAGRQGATAGQPTPSLEAITERSGSRIGRYRLTHVLGEGGMGVVYLAEQEQPVKRQVAFKIIKPGMDSKRVIARCNTAPI